MLFKSRGSAPTVEKRGGITPKRALMAAAAVAVIGFTFAIGVMQVTGGAGAGPDEGIGGQASSFSPADGTPGATPGSGDHAYPANGRVYGTNHWTFLSSEETVADVEDQIYTLLVEDGMANGDYVYVIGDWETTDTGYRGWVQAGTSEQIYQVEVKAPGFEASASRCDAADVAGIEAEVPEDSPINSAQVEDPVEEIESEDLPEVNDYRDLSKGVPLSDEKALAEVLPPGAASTAEEVLIDGVRAEYGFAADASLSRIYPESIVNVGEVCKFTATFMNADLSSLTLAIEYDGATGYYTGQEIEL